MIWAIVSSRSCFCWLYRASLSLTWKEHNQSHFGVDHLAMSMCRVTSCVVGRGCLLWLVCSLSKTLLAFALLHFLLQGQTWLLFLVSPDFCIPILYDEKDIFFGISRRCCRSSYNQSSSTSLASMVGAQTWITVMLNGLPWKWTNLCHFWDCTQVLHFALFCWLCRLLYSF